jgi:hypothetical protein
MSKQVLIMPLPPGARGSYGVSGFTEALAAPLAATDVLYAFQWTNTVHYAAVESVIVSAVVSGAITTAVATGLELVPVRDFFNAYTGGTVLNTIGVTGHEMEYKSDFPSSLVANIRIANTIPLDLPLVPGTEDGVGLSQILFGTGTTVGTTILASTFLHDRATNSYPLLLSANEGFVVRMALNGPASGTIRVSVSTRWMEITKQVF